MTSQPGCAHVGAFCGSAAFAVAVSAGFASSAFVVAIVVAGDDADGNVCAPLAACVGDPDAGIGVQVCCSPVAACCTHIAC